MGDWNLPRDPLVAFFRRSGAGLHEAEDLTQEVFVKLHRAATTYRPQERFVAYLFRVARNVWIDSRRRRAARLEAEPIDGPERSDGERAPAEHVAASGRDPLDAAASAEEGVRLRAALRRLPEAHRLVFELGAVQELSYAEVGSVLDIPVGTVKSRMFHAVRKLRAFLEDDGGSGGPHGPGGDRGGA